MKTPVPTPDEVLHTAERLAHRADDEATEATNCVCDEVGEQEGFVAAAARRVVERVECRMAHAVGSEPVVKELPALLHTVEAAIRRRPVDLTEVCSTLGALLEFLASPAGRTDANCRATDLFFSARELGERDWAHLPEVLRSILWDMGARIHDTFGAPEIAARFESTPEQLLARLRAVDAPDDTR